MLLFLICPDLLQDISLFLNIHLILFDIFYLNITTYIPTPKEQQKIASCLSSLDSLIEAQNKKVSYKPL
jgi:type I restriction enzyme S subunit